MATVLILLCTPQSIWASNNTTLTTLVVRSGGISVATLSAGATVTLSASVTVGGTAITTGQVVFCDALATSCTDMHRLGLAQLTSSGSASLSLVPGIGAHSYKAVFAGDTSGAASESSAQPLTITGSFATTTSLAASGTTGDYTLVASVTGESNTPVPLGGTVSFLDATNSDVVLGTAVLANAQSLVLFKPGLTQATGSFPVFVTTADFNGDGYSDAVVSNNQDSSLTILLGKGDGTFTATPVVHPGGVPRGAVTGDWNGDGKPDLAVTTLANGVQVLLGAGDGTFTAISNPIPGSQPYDVVTADFNGDGYADLAVNNYGDNTVTLLLGYGDGTFHAVPALSPTGDAPFTMVAADFNGDSLPDLATVNYKDNTLTILLSKGDGTFLTGATPSVGLGPWLIVASDFNADGDIDLAVTNSADNTVSVLLGKGDGTFTAAASPLTGTTPLGIALADFDGDGKSDLVVANSASNNLTYLLGNGDGSFTPSPTMLPGGTTPFTVTAADLNGDGVPDLLTTNFGDNTMTVLLTQNMKSAVATLIKVAPIGTGTHKVLASFPLTAPFGASQSATTQLTAAISASTLALTATPANSSFGDQVVLTAKLSPFAPEGLSTDTEIITFYNGTSAIGMGTLSDGVATLTLSSLPIGTNSITAVFAGDANLATSTSAALTVTVVNNSLTMTLTGGTITTDIAADGTATYAFMVIPGSSSTFGENVTFAVTGGPTGASNTFNPASLAAGSPASTVTLTVALPAKSAVQRGTKTALARRLSPMALALVLLPFASRLRRSGRKPGGSICLLILLVTSVGFGAGLAGCGGATRTVTVPTPTPAATNYTLTVTATTGASTTATALKLTVQ